MRHPHSVMLNAFRPLKITDPHLREDRVYNKRVKSPTSIGHPIHTFIPFCLSTMSKKIRRGVRSIFKYGSTLILKSFELIERKQSGIKSPSAISQYRHILTVILLALMVFTTHAHAVGLEKAKGVLEIIKTEILGIVPIIAVIALIGLGIGYAMNSVNKETFMRWAVGLIIIGSAAQITSMLLG